MLQGKYCIPYAFARTRMGYRVGYCWRLLAG